MTKLLRELQTAIDQRLKQKNRKKLSLDNIKTAASIGWSFVLCVLIFVVIGHFISKAIPQFRNFIMVLFILSGTGLGFFNMFYILKNYTKKKEG